MCYTSSLWACKGKVMDAKKGCSYSQSGTSSCYKGLSMLKRGTHLSMMSMKYMYFCKVRTLLIDCWESHDRPNAVHTDWRRRKVISTSRIFKLPPLEEKKSCNWDTYTTFKCINSFVYFSVLITCHLTWPFFFKLAEHCFKFIFQKQMSQNLILQTIFNAFCVHLCFAELQYLSDLILFLFVYFIVNCHDPWCHRCVIKKKKHKTSIHIHLNSVPTLKLTVTRFSSQHSLLIAIFITRSNFSKF